MRSALCERCLRGFDASVRKKTSSLYDCPFIVDETTVSKLHSKFKLCTLSGIKLANSAVDIGVPYEHHR